MKNSAARKLGQVPGGYLRVGVDLHKKQHVAVTVTEHLVVRSKFKFDNSKFGFEGLLDQAKADMVKASRRGVFSEGKVSSLVTIAKDNSCFSLRNPLYELRYD